MDRTHRCTAPCPTALIGAAAILATLAIDARADSALQQGSPTGAALSATAHLDFRVVVLPSLALSMHATGWRVQGNGGALTLQRSAADAVDGSAPRASVQINPRRRVTDTSMPVSTTANGNLITIASP